MKKHCKFSGILVLLFPLILFNGCKKDEVVVDPADQFVSFYSYVMTISGGLTASQSGDFNITKISSTKIVSTLANGSRTYDTVNGNTMTEDPEQISSLPISATQTATFAESSTGQLNAKTLTITGTWKRAGYPTTNFVINATKK
jgi:hypothetical protein